MAKKAKKERDVSQLQLESDSAAKEHIIICFRHIRRSRESVAREGKGRRRGGKRDRGQLEVEAALSTRVISDIRCDNELKWKVAKGGSK